jgi:hypothetical protein
LIIGAALAMAAIALAISQSWLAFANLVPLAFMLACGLMMLKYMKGQHGHQAENERTIASPEAPVPGMSVASPIQATRQLTPARRFTG